MNFDEKLSEKINEYLKRLDEINNLLTLEEVITDDKMAIRLEKERKILLPIADNYNEMNKLKKELKELESNDLDILIDEITAAKEKVKKLEADLISYIAGINSINQKIIIELNVVQLHSNKLFDFLIENYQNFCNANNLNYKILESESDFVKVLVEGQNAYDLFKNENGIHKSSNSSVQVIVYNYYEFESESFGEDDIKIDIFRSNGAGGQNVNKVSTAVRITHLKTGIVVSCQDERSQIQNRQRALENLKEKVDKVTTQNYNKKINAERKKHINKTIIRNYNFDKNVITDLKTKTEFEIGKNVFDVILNLKKLGS